MSTEEPTRKRAKREKPLVFHLTSLRGGTNAQNQYAKGFQELIEGDFTHAILTNYKVDVEWLFQQSTRLQSVPMYLVHGSQQARIVAECKQFKNVIPIAPPLPIAYGTHHTKMMILFFPTKVRVAIFTANFVAGDWDNKTQGIWTQEFPLKTNLSPSKCTFETDLLDYMEALGKEVARLCQEKLRLYDFSSANVALVASVPGVYQGQAAMEKYGHLRVRKLLQQYKFQPKDHPLMCQYSSLGSLDEKWLAEFYKSMTCHASVATPIPPAKLHCIWPSVEAVRNSNEGWDAGRSLPCALKNLKPFLHKYLRMWHPPDEIHRQNAMPHIKSYAMVDTTTQTLDYVLLTSANLSKAAWGAFQKGNTQFMIRSYELGVLRLPQEHESLHFIESPTIDENALYCPVPFRWPPTRYNTKTDEPWTWDIERTTQDCFGEVYRVD